MDEAALKQALSLIAGAKVSRDKSVIPADITLMYVAGMKSHTDATPFDPRNQFWALFLQHNKEIENAKGRSHVAVRQVGTRPEAVDDIGSDIAKVVNATITHVGQTNHPIVEIYAIFKGESGKVQSMPSKYLAWNSSEDRGIVNLLQVNADRMQIPPSLPFACS